MRCPKCSRQDYLPHEPCPDCHFTGQAELITELTYIRWLLQEIDAWQDLGISEYNRQRIQQVYYSRQRQLEVELDLRLPPFTEAEAKAGWSDLFQREALRQALVEWQTAGRLKPQSAQLIIERVEAQIKELTQQLEGHQRPSATPMLEDRLETTRFLLEAVDYLHQNNGFVSATAEADVRDPLSLEQEQLEIELGLRPAPESSPVADDQAAADESLTVPEPPPQKPLPVPKPPTAPLRERIWRTLLSERTLHAVLVLGIFLLFTAALSFVVWGWKDFSAPLRVAIPTGFTAVCFALGWYVRTKTPLYRSGIALSAIAALLIPIDFYTIYINFNIPPNFWPTFWLITSLFCIGAYIITTLIIRSRFFSYLVAMAAGSAVLALIEVGHQLVNISLDWRTAGLSLLALGLVGLGALFNRHPQKKRYIFAAPFSYIALLAVGVILPLTLGWRYLSRNSFDTLHYALTINGWVGALLFSWGALHHRSRSLGLLSVIAWPLAVYLTQAVIFHQLDISPAWQAVGLALLTPLYFSAGHRFSKHDVPIMQDHARSAIRWGLVLLVIVTLWPLLSFRNSAAAASHTILAGAVILAAFLWRRPTFLYGASLFSLSATTFATAQTFMTLQSFGVTASELTLPKLSVAWILLALFHVLIALGLGTRFPIPLPTYVKSIVVAAYTIAGAAIVLPLFPYDGQRLAYALGNWIGMAVWGARLVQTNQSSFTITAGRRKSIFHWFTALPLPFWMWVLFANRGPLDATFPLALAALAWGLVALSYRLDTINKTYRLPWYLTGLVVSVVAPLAAFEVAPNGFVPAVTLLLTGFLYFVDAVSRRQSAELAPAGFVTAWGYTLLLSRFNLSFDAISFGLAVLGTIYLVVGLWVTYKKPIQLPPQFLTPLYLTAQTLTAFVLWRIYVRPFNHLIFVSPWTDNMRLWGAGAQLLLGGVYGLYAWGVYKERWAHFAAWLAAASGGFLAIAYSTGRGSSAAKAALIALVFILAERTLHRLRRHPRFRKRQQAFFRLTWHLYKRPLLITGWVVSAGVIGLALIRNLLLLEGGRTQQIWAIIGLALVTGLYALSARLFRQARFAWLAAGLSFAPWTIITNLGWFTDYRPTLPGFALSWVLLAWVLFLVGLGLKRWASRAYALAPVSVAHLLLPFSLIWGITDVDTSRFTFGLTILLYGTAAVLDHRRLKQGLKPGFVFGKTKFLYLALSLTPVWSLYLLAWLLPGAQREHYGLLLTLFGPAGLLIGGWLKRTAPTPELKTPYSLPAYLTGYGAALIGVLLVAHEPAVLALVLLFNALLMIVSAGLFRNPIWLFPAVGLSPLSLLLALHEGGIGNNRWGWGLIGLASVYLVAAWLLRRGHLRAYSLPPMVAASILIAVSLPFSSQDQIGALGGYSGAVILYAMMAFRLKQPLLLTPTCLLVTIPYAIGLQRSGLASEYYGLALFPGAITALALGWWLDRRLGDWRDFPWSDPSKHIIAISKRLLGWWGLPLYMLGFSLATVSPGFTATRAGLSALNFLLMMPIFGWAIYRFRLRIWLFATVLAGHLVAALLLAELGWWRYPASAWLRFLPVTLVTTLVALIIERKRSEGAPIRAEQKFDGWSHPLYIILLFDIIIGQRLSLEGSWPALMVTLTHALLIAALASLWLSRRLSYISLIFGTYSFIQWLLTIDGPFERMPVALSLLALSYGIIGYGLAFIRLNLSNNREVRPWLALWELPLQRLSILISLGTLVLTAWLGIDIIGWTVRALFGDSFREIINLITVEMVVGVFAFIGVLYLTAAFIHRWLELGYLAVGMLITSWTTHTFYIRQWDNLQFYAIPIGGYLLAIAYLEWRRGNRVQACWLDYLALTLMIGSLFWQTLLYGFSYALMLGIESLLILWWGSARRLRRFLYAGMVGMVSATLGQLINSFWSINQWIVFGTVGTMLVILAVLIERKLDDIKLWQESLEAWE